MNKIITTLIIIFVLGGDLSLCAQHELCFKITDTTHLQANLFILRRECGECPTFYFIVDNEEQKRQAINSFWLNTPPPQGQLMLATLLDSRFFALLKIFSEDSLSSRFSDQEVSRALMSRIHPDSTNMMKQLPLESPLRRINDLVYLCTDYCTLSLLDLPDISFVKRKAPMKYKKIYKCRRRPKYKVYDLEFNSWGIIVEFTSNCQCFLNDTQECSFLEEWPDYTLRLFIPMSKTEQQ